MNVYLVMIEDPFGGSSDVHSVYKNEDEALEISNELNLIGDDIVALVKEFEVL